MESLFSLVALTLILVLIPGPNVALIVANSLKYGTRFGLVTVAGTTLGVAVQLALIVFGLSAVLSSAVEVLVWLKWLGAGYLVYLGIKALRARAPEVLHVKATDGQSASVFWRGMVLAVINPKTLIFNAAFLPQFISMETAGLTSILMVAGVFLFVLGAGDALWAVCAGFVRGYLSRFHQLTNRISGAFLILAGTGLAIAKND